MAFGSVTLLPGVNLERTPTLNQAAISQSSLVRFKDSLVQKLGGWTRFYPLAVSGTPRALHAFEDLNLDEHLLVGTTTVLGIITNGSFKDISQQILISDFAPNFTTVISTPTVTITDPNISNVTVCDAVYFNTPVSVGGLILQGVYQIATTLGGSSYTITAATNATSSVSNGGAVPLFTTTSGSNIVEVTLNGHGASVPGTAVFEISTTGNGVTIQGNYAISTIVDVNNFNIGVQDLATGSSSFSMNGGNAELTYLIAFGPPPAGAGYGTGTYGSGGYGTGTTGSAQTGTNPGATDWTLANWGEIGLACPTGFGVYQYDPTDSFQNLALIPTAPFFNTGIFVSTSQQILVCYGASLQQAVGVSQDPLLVKWSTVGDFTDFAPTADNQAGSFRIPTGNRIVTGLATPNQNLIWTDLDCWAMNYQGVPFVFGFNKIGAGAGAISLQSAQQLRGGVYWMGQSNFYALTSSGVQVLPCPVWDFVFQNMNTAFTANVRAMPNTNFNEVGWLFPSSASTSGECDSYVKFNITEQNTPWDYGSLPRSAWIDQSIFGPPIGANSGGIIYQHETSNDADGAPLVASFTTGYFYISEGEDFAFVDQVMPDFKWGFFGAPSIAQVQLTFNVVNFPGDTPTTYGPYPVTQQTQYQIVRLRGRQMSITAQSNDSGSFWRLGRVRYRYAASGRR